MWAPVTFLGVEVNRLSGAKDATAPASYRRLSNESVEMSALDGADPDASHLEHGPAELDPSHESSGELSGIYFGILNIYTTIPQFIGTFISTIVFSIFAPGTSPELHGGSNDQKRPNTDGPNAISICMFIGAISATVAIFATNKLRYL
jgi:solute carrier family 45, member 1/2/4